MHAATGLLGGSIILVLLSVVLGIAIIVFDIWLIISAIQLIRYAKWKMRNDYGYMNRRR